ncbi:MAG: hypothetical protein ACOH19_14655 [Rhodoglobus sp.]
MFYEHSRRGWALISWVIYVTASACAYASVAGLLVALVANLAVKEVFGTEFVQPDDLWRMEIGVSALAFSGFLAVALLFLSLSRLAYVRQLARTTQREDSADQIPGPRAQRIIALTSPFGGFYILAAYFLLFGVGGAVILSFTLAETARSNPESAREGQGVLTLIVAIIVLLVLLLVAAGLLWSPQWRLAVAQCSSTWSPERVRTAEKQARNRVPNGALQNSSSFIKLRRFLGVALGISGLLFMAATFMRKPGRRADIRYFDTPGETLIDVLVGLSGVVTLLCIAVLLLWGVHGLVSHIHALGRLRGVAEGRIIPVGSGTTEGKNARKAAAQRYEDVLSTPWPAQTLGATLVGLGWGNAPLVYATEQALPGSWPSWLFATQVAIGAGGIILLALSDAAGARYRNVLRAAWG